MTATTQAKGEFEVKLTPQSTDEGAGSTLGRFTNDKVFRGELEATSKGEMLTAGTEVKGSAGYVLIERVTGTLHGRTGAFVLQHDATLDRGAPQQRIIIVPDSASGQLLGLKGSMTIQIESGRHFYTLTYSLPDAG